MDITSGTQVVIRDEQWLVRSVATTTDDGLRLSVTGTSELVRDQDAIFLTALDDVTPLDPADVKLVVDDSPAFRRSRLWLEAVMRQSPVPRVDDRITVGHKALLDPMGFQLKPAQQALDNLRPRLLIGDAVGLGKTLEVGILMSELIRRGRGERILVVTPRAVLEQFQHELWTRFSIPLVRLDSEGIQRVRRTLPSTRNPFSYYRRVIVSLDTLKNPARYRHHLEKQRWDIVVIDECHNVITPGTQNNQLARLLARQTDALILASATPHNGRMESFAELISMLDPTAIADPKDYEARDIEHLFVRRHRNSPDVQAQVGTHWAQREDPDIRPVPATPAEEAVLAELSDTWLHRQTDDPLFGWTLLKAFLSSPQALATTIERRLKRNKPSETEALTTLQTLADQAQPSSKSAALLDYLRDIKVGKNSPTRVVIFSERIDTLTWLHDFLRRELRLPAKAVGLLHAQLPDTTVQDIVEGFSLESSPLRVLLASDMASEGINLHRQCHHLVHYDLPWSFITIQQRNGRIDRYQQLHAPQIAALALTSTNEEVSSDLRVVTRLLQKEHAANQALGDAGSLLKLHDPEIEERTVFEALSQGRTLDDLVPENPQDGLTFFERMMLGADQTAVERPPQTANSPSLFDDDDNFLWEVLQEIGATTLNAKRDEDTDLVAFDTPEDLAARLRDLPDGYLKDRGVTERIRLSANTHYAAARLAKARKDGDTLWPDVHYLSPIHPVLEWAATRTLSQFGRNQAPVLAGEVAEPVVLTQAVWANAAGQVTLARWGAWTAGDNTVHDLLDTLHAAGIREDAINSGITFDDALHDLVAPALHAAADDLKAQRADLEATLDADLSAHEQHLRTWTQSALERAESSTARHKNRALVDQTSTAVSDIIDSQRVTGEPFVRVVGVIVPRG